MKSVDFILSFYLPRLPPSTGQCWPPMLSLSMLWNETIKALITALGIGLMIGVIRERRNRSDESKAGTRTHALIAILGALSWVLGTGAFTATLFIVGAFAVVGYYQSAQKNPGLTSEVAIVLTFVLGAMTHVDISLAAALGVLIAILLNAKSPIQRMSRDLISEQELGEALLILASALIVMPLLPNKPIDPWNVLELNNIWRIVVLIMVMGMAGHIARRAFGAKLGFPIAGFFSGFASSTAAIASLGQKVKEEPALVYPAAASSLLANLSSLLLFISIIGAVSPELLTRSVIPLGSAVAILLLMAAFILIYHRPKNEVIHQSSGRSFKLSHAVIIALVISSVSLVSVWMNQAFGEAGVLIANAIVGLAEIHAAAASLGQLSSSGGITMHTAEWGIITVIGSSCLAKSFLSFLSGGKQFGILVTSGLSLMMIVLITTMVLR